MLQVFAQRCMESGLIEMRCDIKPPNDDGKIAHFLRTVEEQGITFSEPEQYETVYPWTRQRPEKPWEFIE